VRGSLFVLSGWLVTNVLKIPAQLQGKAFDEAAGIVGQLAIGQPASTR
jgi:hypothetical protein